jgi:hypothetical protein
LARQAGEKAAAAAVAVGLAGGENESDVGAEEEEEEEEEGAGGEGEAGEAGEEVEPEWPADMLCPISWVPMDDAVMAADGHSYQRAAIEEWIARKQAGKVEGNPESCPVRASPPCMGIIVSIILIVPLTAGVPAALTNWSVSVLGLCLSTDLSYLVCTWPQPGRSRCLPPRPTCPSSPRLWCPTISFVAGWSGSERLRLPSGKQPAARGQTPDPLIT